MTLGQQIAEKYYDAAYFDDRNPNALADLIDTMHAADKEAHAQKATERWGTEALFECSPEEVEGSKDEPSKLREAIDAAMKGKHEPQV